VLQAGVDCAVIALWLGHESIETTQTYLHAHLALKEQPWQSSNRTNVASEPASSRTSACSPSFRRCRKPWGNVRSMGASARKRALLPEPFGIVRRAA
jgi:hypothetical protein